MSLTPEQQLEMYSDIKVIKNNCVRCFKCQEDHEQRLKHLEDFVQTLKDDKKWVHWIYGSVGAGIVWLLTVLKDIFFRG